MLNKKDGSMFKYAKISSQDNSLREYQQEAKSAIFEAWDKYNNVMFQMPTGTGKTRLFSSIIKDILDNDPRNGKILIIAHRKELIDQISDCLNKYYKIEHSLIIASKKRDLTKRVIVASIASFMHKKTRNKEEYVNLDIDYVVIDEAHHTMARTYAMLCKRYRDAKKLGVTATPWRMNHSGFMFFDCTKRKQEYFQKLVETHSIKWFIKKGFLAPYQYYSIRQDSEESKAIRSITGYDEFGDYKISDSLRAMDKQTIRARLYDSYKMVAAGKKGLIYAINQEHAEHICEEYKNKGIRIENINSKTNKKERSEILKRFENGRIDIIVNVDIFSEGFDCPDIEFIQLARPTKSLAIYLQQVGRGLRPAKNKTYCTIIDNVGLYQEFGLPNADRKWQHHFEGSTNIEEINESPKPKAPTNKTKHISITEGNEPIEKISDEDNTIQTTFSFLHYLRLGMIIIREGEKDILAIPASSDLGQMMNAECVIIERISEDEIVATDSAYKELKFNKAGVTLENNEHKKIAHDLYVIYCQKQAELEKGNSKITKQIQRIENCRDKRYDEYCETQIPRIGYCIRCGQQIPFTYGNPNPMYYCKDCLEVLNDGKKKKREHYCHCCRKELYKRITFNNPLCRTCSRKEKKSKRK